MRKQNILATLASFWAVQVLSCVFDWSGGGKFYGENEFEEKNWNKLKQLFFTCKNGLHIAGKEQKDLQVDLQVDYSWVRPCVRPFGPSGDRLYFVLHWRWVGLLFICFLFLNTLNANGTGDFLGIFEPNKTKETWLQPQFLTPIEKFLETLKSVEVTWQKFVDQSERFQPEKISPQILPTNWN